MKKYEELGFSDQFMFNKLMEDPKLCKRVLELLLQTELSELTTPIAEKGIKETADGKAIRLDVYTKDSVSGAVYDAEMQNLNRRSVDSLYLPERSRYYQSAIDTAELKEGDDYRKLPDCNIIFLCTFDPFDKGLYRYSFGEYCEESPGLMLQSRARKVFFNTLSCNEKMPKAISCFFNYINTGIPSDEFTREIEKMVEEARNNVEWSREYLLQKVWRRDIIEEGREEGREIGLVEGRAEGRAEGRLNELVQMLENGATEDILRKYNKATDEEIATARERLASSDEKTE
ncbi:MAG: Rpn family recombination-promoting nuclease/putative transposase [Lachnospiraceae bacterium]|nr:Rpn family recombination-promoting nuclease/putative transposase [Lachnospiraceae bacterium]MBR5994808.1 Rpn family recombination-promoting nuclease/putative transposase [Lachnospiraceae bacterium]